MGFFIIKILWFLIIVFGAYFIYALFTKGDKKEPEKDDTPKDDWSEF